MVVVVGVLAYRRSWIPSQHCGNKTQASPSPGVFSCECFVHSIHCSLQAQGWDVGWGVGVGWEWGSGRWGGEVVTLASRVTGSW